MTQIEVLSSPERRRRWSAEQKRSIVAEAFASGASVCEVARRADVVPSLIYRWRRELRTAAVGFAEVVVAPGRTRERWRARQRWRSSSAGTFACALRRRRPRIWYRQSSRRWQHDDPVADRGSGLDRGGPYRHAAWDAQPGAAGAGGAQARSVRGRSLRFPRAQRLVDKLFLWHDGIGISLYAKRLERGRCIWPSANDGTVSISTSQLAYMLDRNRRNPQHVASDRGRMSVDNAAAL